MYGHGPYEGVYGDGETGVFGHGPGGCGVIGDAHSTSWEEPDVWGPYGVWGHGGDVAGVRGDSSHMGVMARDELRGVGDRLADKGLTFGVFASTSSSGGYAGWFQGRVHVNGTLSTPSSTGWWSRRTRPRTTVAAGLSSPRAPTARRGSGAPPAPPEPQPVRRRDPRGVA